jgi:hypothetical protein
VKPKYPKPIVLLVFGFWIFWGFGLHTVGKRFDTQVDGIIISSRDNPPSRGPRYATEYVLRGPNGEIFSYVAGPTDASLPRSMPVGTTLKKMRWHLDYDRNGQHVNDFPVAFYSGALGIAVGCVIWSFVIWQRQRTAP